METNFYNNTPNSTGIRLNQLAEDFLRSTAKWGRFVAIAGFIAIGLVLIVGLFAGALMTGIMGPRLFGFSGGSIATFNFIAVIYAVPILYLYRFSSKMLDSLNAQDEDQVAESFKNLKSMFKFIGIFTIIILSLYLISLVFVLFGISKLVM